MRKAARGGDDIGHLHHGAAYNMGGLSPRLAVLKHKAARSVQMDLRIGPFSEGEFSALYSRFMALFGVDRSLFTVTVPLSAEMLVVDLGDVLKLQWPRFNLTDGRLLRVVSVRYALRERQIEFALWG